MQAQTKRTLHDDYAQFDALIPKSDGKTTTVKANISPLETVETIQKIVAKYAYQTAKIAPKLKGKTLNETLQNIWDFNYNYIQYQLDEPGFEQLKTPARMWAERIGGDDCDGYAIMTSSILTNLRVPHFYRIAKYQNRSYWQHIYVVVPKEGVKFDPHNKQTYHVIDPVKDGYDVEHPYTAIKDFEAMPTGQILSGLGGLSGDNFTEYAVEGFGRIRRASPTAKAPTAAVAPTPKKERVMDVVSPLPSLNKKQLSQNVYIPAYSDLSLALAEILTTPAWLMQIRQKAANHGISFNEQLFRDAVGWTNVARKEGWIKGKHEGLAGLGSLFNKKLIENFKKAGDARKRMYRDGFHFDLSIPLYESLGMGRIRSAAPVAVSQAPTTPTPAPYTKTKEINSGYPPNTHNSNTLNHATTDFAIIYNKIMANEGRLQHERKNALERGNPFQEQIFHAAFWDLDQARKNGESIKSNPKYAQFHGFGAAPMIEINSGTLKDGRIIEKRGENVFVDGQDTGFKPFKLIVVNGAAGAMGRNGLAYWFDGKEFQAIPNVRIVPESDKNFEAQMEGLNPLMGLHDADGHTVLGFAPVSKNFIQNMVTGRRPVTQGLVIPAEILDRLWADMKSGPLSGYVNEYSGLDMLAGLLGDDTLDDIADYVSGLDLDGLEGETSIAGFLGVLEGQAGVLDLNTVLHAQRARPGHVAIADDMGRIRVATPRRPAPQAPVAAPQAPASRSPRSTSNRLPLVIPLRTLKNLIAYRDAAIANLNAQGRSVQYDHINAQSLQGVEGLGFLKNVGNFIKKAADKTAQVVRDNRAIVAKIPVVGTAVAAASSALDTARDAKEAMETGNYSKLVANMQARGQEAMRIATNPMLTPGDITKAIETGSRLLSDPKYGEAVKNAQNMLIEQGLDPASALMQAEQTIALEQGVDLNQMNQAQAMQMYDRYAAQNLSGLGNVGIAAVKEQVLKHFAQYKKYYGIGGGIILISVIAYLATKYIKEKGALGKLPQKSQKANKTKNKASKEQCSKAGLNMKTHPSKQARSINAKILKTKCDPNVKSQVNGMGEVVLDYK